MSYKEPETASRQAPQQQQKTFSVSQIFFILIFLSLIGLNAQLFMLAKRYVVKIDTIGEKIDGIQDSVASQDTKITGVSRNLITLSSKQAAFENEFVGIKDKVDALSNNQGTSSEVNALKSSLAKIESQLATLVRSDLQQTQAQEELKNKSDTLIRKFTLYDMELKDLSSQKAIVE